jgi:DNA helicase II / ATP-dependent DNA helicase PcrA
MQIPLPELNVEQQKAATHVEGPMLVLAGAGSGKTRIIVARIAYLLQIGIPCSEILAVTFTNKAAEEMKHRILRLTGSQILTCTFHSLSAKILRESIHFLGYKKDFLIADEEDSEKILKQCFRALNYKEEKDVIKNIRKQISAAKNHLLLPEDLPSEYKAIEKIYSSYQNKLKEYNTLDFDDLLLLTVRLLREHPEALALYQNRWGFLLIDEYQDTNEAQYLLARLLSSKHTNIFAVGDPDQSIYSWRGADMQNILNFERDYPGASVVKLEQNYRSSHNILDAANALIARNKDRYKKNLWGQKGEGEKIGLFIAENDRAEADFVVEKIRYFRTKMQIPYQDCALFYRTNFQSRTFEDALLREKIPYTIIGGLSFYQRKEIKDVLAFLRMIISDYDLLAFNRTINLPRRGFGLAILEKIQGKIQEVGIDIFSFIQRVIAREIELPLSSKQRQGLEEYTYAVLALREMNKAGKPLKEILSGALERFRYLEYIREDAETYEERRSNIDELIAKASEWEEETSHPSLVAFLEELSLKSSAEDPNKPSDTVKLMTLHNGKGLEFPLVFLVGMEEDLFPHINAKDSASSLEEERRLCYVGMTRAKDHLFLTATRYRFLWGSPRNMRPSRFLQEIPAKHLQVNAKQQKAIYAQTQEQEEPFQIQDAVFHRDFGPGIVHKVYQTSLGLTYDVFFPKTDTVRSLVAKYARLVKQQEAFLL